MEDKYVFFWKTASPFSNWHASKFEIDGTSFDSRSEKDIRKELLTLGFKENGTETMYNGITGEKFKVQIYIGNMYYFKVHDVV